MGGVVIPMNLGTDSYDITLERGALRRAGKLLNLRRRVMIVTDSGVPEKWPKTLAEQCEEAEIFAIPAGEKNKNLDSFREVLRRMLAFGMRRGDCVAAVGGGVPGDLAGFAAACYMRGIDFYNCPTTVLSQVDSSIGGKTAVDLDGIKNIVGAFWQPKAVLIDPDVLSTLPRRQVSNGLAEAVKMALCFDEEGFALFENGDVFANMDQIIENALRIKKYVVEQDEKEQGLRRTLNFGHTLGHGIEALQKENGLYHGECVALGMLPMCSPDVWERLRKVLEKLELPVCCDAEVSRVMEAAVHDKKASGNTITAILSEKIGSCCEKKMTPEELAVRYTEVFGK
jgi:3-dehydroquinate synthase